MPNSHNSRKVSHLQQKIIKSGGSITHSANFYWCEKIENGLCHLVDIGNAGPTFILEFDISKHELIRKIIANRMFVGNSFDILESESKLTDTEKAKQIAENVYKYFNYYRAICNDNNIELTEAPAHVGACLGWLKIKNDIRIGWHEKHLIINGQEFDRVKHSWIEAEIDGKVFLIDANLKDIGYVFPSICFMEVEEAMKRYNLRYDREMESEYWHNWQW